MNVNTNSRFWDHVLIFFVSFVSIALELYFTRVLNLKTFNHVVYVIVPFALLGYGIGAQFYLLTREWYTKWPKNVVLGTALLKLAAVILISYFSISKMLLSVALLQDFFQDISNGLTLSLAYLVFMLPFVVIGYIVLYLFSQDSCQSPVLYFWDLLGAGLGAFAFFFMIEFWQVTGSYVLMAVLSAGLGVVYLKNSWAPAVAVVTLAGIILSGTAVTEMFDYRSDGKGWENFPNYYQDDQYEVSHSRWHPLGRTDAWRLTERRLQERLYNRAVGTFQINQVPFPEFTYLSTNYLGGTPVYRLSEEGLGEYGSRQIRFSQAMEFPYLLLEDPRVVVIGAGGGRDVYHALSHGAVSVKGAEINPEIYRLMTPGGDFHAYSGGVYTNPRAEIFNVDGRYLVKSLPENSADLIVLNGVDTYSGLSTGAYAYAESYLYTRDAIEDYLDLLSDTGMVNFNRWFFKDAPRETLRLFAIIMEAMQRKDIHNPWEHVVVAEHDGWGMVLAKKSPFTGGEYEVLTKYFEERDSEMIYPSAALQRGRTGEINWFDRYALFLKEGRADEFRKKYMFDISVITDDNPFFYKYYRLRDLHPDRLARFSNYGAGMLAFFTQGLVLINATVFSLLFIFLPQWILRRDQLKAIPGHSRAAFIVYYLCLGAGFMFIEIPLMQKFALLLGSPIYSISITLAAVLIFSGLGSLFLPLWQKRVGNKARLVTQATVILTFLVLGLLVFSPVLTGLLIGLPFALRVIAVILMICPVGLCLGIYFPSGMQLIGPRIRGAMSWAWGINAGFSVIGSMLSISLAQFYGFNTVFLLALVVYWIAALCYRRMAVKGE